jgi:hypothetical protein
MATKKVQTKKESVPVKRVHPDVLSGKLTDSYKYIINYEDDNLLVDKEENKEIDPRWETLKKILTDKKN